MKIQTTKISHHMDTGNKGIPKSAIGKPPHPWKQTVSSTLHTSLQERTLSYSTHAGASVVSTVEFALNFLQPKDLGR